MYEKKIAEETCGKAHFLIFTLVIYIGSISSFLQQITHVHLFLQSLFCTISLNGSFKSLKGSSN